MAIGRTARGTANGVITGGLGASTLLAGVTVGATGSTLVAFVSYGSGIDVIYGMTWNGTTLGKRPAVGVNPYLECYVLENATAGTGAIVIDDAGGSIGKWELLVTEITGAAAASFDVSASGSGTGTAPSSGNTATTAQANEMLLGAVYRANATIDGTFSGSFSQGQTQTQTSRSVEECYRSVTATGAYAAAKTGCTSSVWLAVVATFKEGATNQTATPPTITVASAVMAVALVLGGVLSSCDSVNSPGNVMVPTWSLARVVEPARAVTGVPNPDSLFLDSYRANTQTVHAATIDGTSLPVTLRSNTAPLGDANWSTYTSVAATFGSGSGTSLVDGFGVANSGIAGTGEISGVAFFVACRTLHDNSGLVYSNARMGSVPFAMSPAAPTSGSFVTPPAWSVLTTGTVATSDGITPWSWATLYAALSSGVMTFRINWTNSDPFVDIGQVDVADIWVEVWGPIGSEPDIVKFRQKLGPLPVIHPLGPMESVQNLPSIINGG